MKMKQLVGHGSKPLWFNKLVHLFFPFRNGWRVRHAEGLRNAVHVGANLFISAISAIVVTSFSNNIDGPRLAN